MIDVAPTVLEVAGLPQPTFVNGVLQKPLEGVSMVYSFNDADGGRAPRDAVLRDVRQSRHLPQRLDGGDEAPDAVAAGPRSCAAFDDDVWELYDTTKDWTQANDLAKEQPGQAARAATPLADRGDQVQRAAARRPRDRALQPRDVLAVRSWSREPPALFGGMGRLTECSILNMHNKSYAITADCDRPEDGADGVIVALGGITGGWSLYAKAGKPKYCYNFFGLKQFYVEGRRCFPRAPIRCGSSSPTKAAGRPRAASHALPRRQTGRDRPHRTHPARALLGRRDLRHRHRIRITGHERLRQREFTGEVNWVQLDHGEVAKNADHYITVADRLRIAIGVQ